jgi:hypothetical protein
MRLLSISLTVLLATSLFAPRASAEETETAAATRAKKQLEMQIDYAKIAGMKSVVDHLSASNLQCESIADCVSMPMGKRACGGPTSYVVTSKLNASLEAVVATVELVTQAEKDANQKYGMASICSMVMPPPLGCNANVCESR